MKNSTRLLWISAAVSTLLMASCQKVAKLPELSSGGVDAGSAESTALTHTEEFKNTALHGSRYLNGGACFGCHDGEPAAEQGAASAARLEKGGKKRACASCHETFPHGKQFLRKHGEMYFEDPQTCLKCHGQKQEGRGRAVACTTCHEASHTSEFKTTRAHGTRFLKEREEDAVSCWKCHTETKPRDQTDSDARSETGRGLKRSCGICHGNYPHPKGFDDSKKHGKAFRDDSSDCAVCHGRDFAGAGQSISCKDCHEFPHAGTWGLPGKHGQAFMKERSGAGAMVACADCHGKGAKVSCDSCHYWHLEAGLEPHVANAQKVRNGCTNCHTDGRRLMAWEKGCFECHEESTELKVPRDWETLQPEKGRAPQSVGFKGLKKVPAKAANPGKKAN